MVVLDDVKGYLGIDVFESAFDKELLALINAAFLNLVLLGVSEVQNVVVTETTSWPTFSSLALRQNSTLYVKLKTKITFDPSSNSTISEANTRFLQDLEVRFSFLIPPEESQGE